MNDEQLWERRRNFLTSRMAGATFSAIAQGYNKRALDEGMQRGIDPDDIETVSATTVRKDVQIARQELIDDATRDALRGEHRAILLDMRRANYQAMAGGDVDAAKIVMSTLVREAEMFGLDDPKRSVVGVGTNVEFASDLVALFDIVGRAAPDDLVFQAHSDRRDAIEAGPVDADVIPFDLDAPEPRRDRTAVGAAHERTHDGDERSIENDDAAAHGASHERPAPPPDEPDEWANI